MPTPNELDQIMQLALSSLNQKPQLTRLEANREILKTLAEVLEKHPDLRFVQALHALEIIENDIDKFYQESTATLESLRRNELTK